MVVVSDLRDDPGHISAVHRRVRIVEAAIASYRTRAFHEVDVDVIADAGRISVEEIREHFPHPDGLTVAVIDRWNAQRTHPLVPIAHEHGTVLFLRAIVEANIADPALMRFLSATLNISATPGHPMAAQLHTRWRDFQVLVQRSLAHDIEVGREPSTMVPARGAEQVIALFEGLQLQYMVRPKMDLLDAFDRGMTRLRDGWSRAYVRPVWDVGYAG